MQVIFYRQMTCITLIKEMEICACGESLTCLGGFCKSCIYSQVYSFTLSCEEAARLKHCLQEGQVCERCYKVNLTCLELSEQDDFIVFACPECSRRYYGFILAALVVMQ